MLVVRLFNLNNNSKMLIFDCYHIGITINSSERHSTIFKSNNEIELIFKNIIKKF